MHELNRCSGGCVSRKVVAAGVSPAVLLVAAAVSAAVVAAVADCGPWRPLKSHRRKSGKRR